MSNRREKGELILQSYSQALPQELLEQEYNVSLLSERDLSQKYRIPRQWIRRLLKLYNISPLSKGDRSQRKFPSIFTQEQIDLIIGTLLGDGGIYERERQSGPGLCYYKISHKVECRLLVDCYREVLTSFQPRLYEDFQHKNGRVYLQIGITTPAAMIWRPFRELFYRDSIKIWDRRVLSYMNPSVLAYWYAGDGSYDSDHRSETGDVNISSSLLRDLLNDADDFCSFWEGQGLHWKHTINPSNPSIRRFTLRRDDQELFVKLILPHLPDGAFYKIPPEFRDLLKGEDFSELTEIWKSGSGENSYQRVLSFYRRYGFPYPNPTMQERKAEFSRISNMEAHKLVWGKQVKHSSVGIQFVNSYHSHIWNTRIRGQATPKENFDSDKILRRVIIDRFKYGRGLYPIQLLVGLRMRQKSPANYPPATAKCLYDTLLPEGGSVLDFSSGYGGRILGAMASNKVHFYMGLEPAEETFRRNHILINDWDFQGKIRLLRRTAEEWCPQEYKNYFDLVFTSPPYFDREEYAEEPNQVWKSCQGLDDYKSWVKKVLENAKFLTKSGGIIAIQISDPVVSSRKRQPLVEIWRSQFSQLFISLDEWLYRSPGGRGARNLESILIAKNP